MPFQCATTLTSSQVTQLSQTLHALILTVESRATRRILLAQLRSYGIHLAPFRTAMNPSTFILGMTDDAQTLFVNAVDQRGMAPALSVEEILESLEKARTYFATGA